MSKDLGYSLFFYNRRFFCCSTRKKAVIMNGLSCLTFVVVAFCCYALSSSKPTRNEVSPCGFSISAFYRPSEEAVMEDVDVDDRRNEMISILGYSRMEIKWKIFNLVWLLLLDCLEFGNFSKVGCKEETEQKV